MLLSGFGFSGYRSIGNQPVILSPLKKINVIIGQNNSGKSNIINFLFKHYRHLTEHIVTEQKLVTNFTSIDKHIQADQSNCDIYIPFYPDENEYLEYIKSIRPENPISGKELELINNVLRSNKFLRNDGNYWLGYRSHSLGGKFEPILKPQDLQNCIKDEEWYILWNMLKGQTGSAIQHWVPETLSILTKINFKCPNVELIPAIRKIGEINSKADDYSGIGIIERLALLQNPSQSQQSLKQEFQSINRFLQTVLENPDANLEIPFNRDTILVHMDGKTLPISSLGTGIHEVIILAAAATVLKNSILCIEEPELHIHPILQRKLIAYLLENTENQYIVTSHSTHFLENPDIQIFHARLSSSATNINIVSTSSEKYSICNDLGYRASDIVQANSVFWVEGPSDRIYINFWLSYLAPDLVEGIHYSIMFFGGKLFKHISSEDIDSPQITIDDLISLKRLNQNSAIVFDSDRDKPHCRLNSTKSRLQREFNSNDGLAWVTKGREIENYINADHIEQSVLEVHPTAKNIICKTRYDNLLKYRKKGTVAIRSANKVKIARYYCANYDPDFTILDLRNRLNDMIDFIRSTN